MAKPPNNVQKLSKTLTLKYLKAQPLPPEEK